MAIDGYTIGLLICKCRHGSDHHTEAGVVSCFEPQDDLAEIRLHFEHRVRLLGARHRHSRVNQNLDVPGGEGRPSTTPTTS